MPVAAAVATDANDVDAIGTDVSASRDALLLILLMLLVCMILVMI